MNGMAGRRVGVMRSLFVVAGLMMLRRFRVVAGGMREVLGCFLMVFCSLL
jgi:hypothetical protein